MCTNRRRANKPPTHRLFLSLSLLCATVFSRRRRSRSHLQVLCSLGLQRKMHHCPQLQGRDAPVLKPFAVPCLDLHPFFFSFVPHLKTLTTRTHSTASLLFCSFFPPQSKSGLAAGRYKTIATNGLPVDIFCDSEVRRVSYSHLWTCTGASFSIAARPAIWQPFFSRRLTFFLSAPLSSLSA